MSSAHSSFPARRLVLLAFLGGGRPPRHALVCVRSLRGLHRLLLHSLLLHSLVGQLVIIGLLLAVGSRGERRPPSLGAPAAGALLRGEGR